MPETRENVPEVRENRTVSGVAIESTELIVAEC